MGGGPPWADQRQGPLGTLLGVATSRYSVKFMIYLLDEHGADPNMRQDNLSSTALHLASSGAKVDALLARGADPTVLCSRGYSPLALYINQGSLSSVERFV